MTSWVVRRRRGVRARTAAAAAAVVGLALVLGAVALVVLLQASLTRSVDASATGHAQQVAAQVAAEGVDGLSQDLAVSAGAAVVVEVSDSAGRLVASSSAVPAGAAGQLPLPASPASPSSSAHLQRAVVASLGGESSVATLSAVHGGQRYAVSAAVPVTGVDRTTSTVAGLLAVGIPLVVLVTGGAAHVLVGRALLPVEGIRREVAAISARSLAERVAVPASGDEIARLATTMNDMLARLDTAAQAQRRFVADASHELRSPLAALRAGLDVVAEDRSGRARAELEEVLQEEVLRMGRLVDDLLLLAKADEGLPVATAQDVDLDDLVERELRRLRTAGGLRATGSAEPARVRGDPSRLALAVRNVVDNAQRHASSALSVSVVVRGGWALLEVDDDGPGISVPDRERVFERFVRLDDSRQRSSGGSGLGLAIVREVMREHGGTASAGRGTLGGARFTLALPTASGPGAAQAPSSRSR